MTDSKKELFKKLEDINEDAHNYVYDLWEEANQLEEENGYMMKLKIKKYWQAINKLHPLKKFLKRIKYRTKRLF